MPQFLRASVSLGSLQFRVWDTRQALIESRPHQCPNLKQLPSPLKLATAAYPRVSTILASVDEERVLNTLLPLADYVDRILQTLTSFSSKSQVLLYLVPSSGK